MLSPRKTVWPVSCVFHCELDMSCEPWDMVAFIGITLLVLCEITSVFTVNSNGKIKEISSLCSGAVVYENRSLNILWLKCNGFWKNVFYCTFSSLFTRYKLYRQYCQELRCDSKLTGSTLIDSWIWQSRDCVLEMCIHHMMQRHISVFNLFYPTAVSSRGKRCKLSLNWSIKYSIIHRKLLQIVTE